MHLQTSRKDQRWRASSKSIMSTIIGGDDVQVKKPTLRF